LQQSRNHGYGEIKLFACNANPALGQAISKHLDIPLGDSKVSKFADGEISVSFNDTVRGRDVFIIQPTSPPNTNDNLMELLVMTDALRRASAERITAVIPYFGYARQDRKDRSHAPISAKLVANLLTAAGVNRVLSMDLHALQIQGFFDVPFDHLRCNKVFVKYFKDTFPSIKEDFVVVSPDLGSVARARYFAKKLDLNLAIVDKRRANDRDTEVMNVIGSELIKGKNVIILDDIIATGGSLINAAAAIKDKGANAIYACITHPVFTENEAENEKIKLRIENSALDKLLVSDTIYSPLDKRPANMEVISVADYFAEAIRCIHENEAISHLFGD